MKAGLQYAVAACQNAIAKGDSKMLSKMFCNDDGSQQNAKDVIQHWKKLSKSDKVGIQSIHV